MENILFNNLSPVELLVDSFDGLGISVRTVQHFLWQASTHLIKPVTRMLFEAGVHPFNAPGIVQHHQKIGRDRCNHGEAIRVHA